MEKIIDLRETRQKLFNFYNYSLKMPVQSFHYLKGKKH